MTAAEDTFSRVLETIPALLEEALMFYEKIKHLTGPERIRARFEGL